jgi:hypothetical protein
VTKQIVQIYDCFFLCAPCRRGIKIEGESLAFLNVKPIVTGNFVDVQVLARDPAESEFRLRIEGLAVGLAKLVAEVDKVKSTPVDVNVFPALRLQPRNITLIPGAVFQVSTASFQTTGTLS